MLPRILAEFEGWTSDTKRWSYPSSDLNPCMRKYRNTARARVIEAQAIQFAEIAFEEVGSDQENRSARSWLVGARVP
jgi:hypothetical protein